MDEHLTKPLDLIKFNTTLRRIISTAAAASVPGAVPVPPPAPA